jgi:hypothetical protein
MGEENLIGEVTHYYSGAHAAIIRFFKPVAIGAKVRFKGATTDFEEVISSMELNHEKITEVKAGEEVGVEVLEKVREGDKVFLVA